MSAICYLLNLEKKENSCFDIFIYDVFQELKDLKTKAEMVKNLMEKGYRVKVLFFLGL